MTSRHSPKPLKDDRESPSRSRCPESRARAATQAAARPRGEEGEVVIRSPASGSRPAWLPSHPGPSASPHITHPRRGITNVPSTTARPPDSASREGGARPNKVAPQLLPNNLLSQAIADLNRNNPELRRPIQTVDPGRLPTWQPRLPRTTNYVARTELPSVPTSRGSAVHRSPAHPPGIPNVEGRLVSTSGASATPQLSRASSRLPHHQTPERPSNAPRYGSATPQPSGSANRPPGNMPLGRLINPATAGASTHQLPRGVTALPRDADGAEGPIEWVVTKRDGEPVLLPAKRG